MAFSPENPTQGALWVRAGIAWPLVQSIIRGEREHTKMWMNGPPH